MGTRLLETVQGPGTFGLLGYRLSGCCIWGCPPPPILLLVTTSVALVHLSIATWTSYEGGCLFVCFLIWLFEAGRPHPKSRWHLRVRFPYFIQRREAEYQYSLFANCNISLLPQPVPRLHTLADSTFKCWAKSCFYHILQPKSYTLCSY